MSEQPTTSFEERARRLFDNSVDDVDMRIRSRLNQARQAALAARGSSPKWGHFSFWSSAVGFSAAAVLGVVVWVGMPVRHGALTAAAVEAATNFEDLEIVASSEEGSGDNLEMLQDDLEFYDWAAEKNANPDAGSVVG